FRKVARVPSRPAANLCGECLLCGPGNYTLWPSRSVFGAGTAGAMASFVCVPARCLHHIPAELPFERAALTEPCCVAYNAVASKSTVRPGDTVVVIGPGPIGLLCTEMARIAGARNLIVGGTTQDPSRLDVGRPLRAAHI